MHRALGRRAHRAGRRAADPSGCEVTTHGGRRGTGIDAVEWAARGQELGVGEILLNSMDADGTKRGLRPPMIAAVRAAVDVPVIACGGAGRVEDFAPAVAAGADAVLAASVFHFGTLRIADVKAQPARGRGMVEIRCLGRGPQSAIPPSPARLKRNADGLVCAVAQQQDTGEVLMVAWMDDEALHRTLTTGRATYWSRSRQEYWVKGETSGTSSRCIEVRLDCDGDAVLLVGRPDRRRLPHGRPHLLRR